MILAKLQLGMTVYSVGRRRMGNTLMVTDLVWPVLIMQVDPETQTVYAKWNGNHERAYHEHEYRKWREQAPRLIPKGCGAFRLATKLD